MFGSGELVDIGFVVCWDDDIGWEDVVVIMFGILVEDLVFEIIGVGNVDYDGFEIEMLVGYVYYYGVMGCEFVFVDFYCFFGGEMDWYCIWWIGIDDDEIVGVVWFFGEGEVCIVDYWFEIR